MKRPGKRRSIKPPLRRAITTVGVVIVVYFFLLLIGGGLIRNELNILLDMIFCGMGFLFWMAFFSQFILPSKTFQERQKTLERLFAYLAGRAGPVIRIDNGKIVARKAETSRSGPGVIILDTASAAMLRTPAEFRPAIGPGLAFTEPNESIAGVVDLHIQRSSLGPFEEEDPFAEMLPEENQPMFEARQKRRFATQGITRNGIPIVPRIGVAVRLDAEHAEGYTHFGYDRDAVQRFITGRPVDLDTTVDSPYRFVELAWFPLVLAADIWKECISRFTIEELFAFAPGQVTAMQGISREMIHRLTRPRYTEMDRFGQPTGALRTSNEYRLIKSRGLRVISASITYIKLQPEVENRLIGMWQSTWLARARREREYIERQRSYEVENGKREGLNAYIEGVTHFIGSQNPALRFTGEQLLRQMIRGSLYLINQDAYLHRQAGEEADQLKDLLTWTEQTPETA